MRQLDFLYELHILITFLGWHWADTCNVFIVLSPSPLTIYFVKSKNTLFNLAPCLFWNWSQDFIFNLKVTITCLNSTHFLTVFCRLWTCCIKFEQRYVKNVFPSLYLGSNESLKGVKWNIRSFLLYFMNWSLKKWLFGDGWTKPNIDF